MNDLQLYITLTSIQVILSWAMDYKIWGLGAANYTT